MAGVPILTSVASGYRLLVEFAPGADLTLDEFSWSWTDITTSVMQDNYNVISITLGRANEASVAQPANCTLRLKNPTGTYTPTNPASAYYPNIRLGTPLRVSVSLDGGSNYVKRFLGYIASWAPGWDAEGRKAYVVVTASGITRRLSQGSKPVLDIMTRYHVRNGAVACWPFDDQLGSTSAANAVPNGSPMQVISTVTFGNTSGTIYEDAVINFPAAGPATRLSEPDAGVDVLAAAVNAPTNGELHIDMWRAQEGAPDATETQLLVIDLDDPTGFWGVEIRARQSQVSPVVHPGWTVTVPGVGAILDSFTGSPGTTTDPMVDGLFHNVHVSLTQNGSNVDTVLYIDGTAVDSHTIVSVVLPDTITDAHVRCSVVVGSGPGFADLQSVLALYGGTATPSWTVGSELYSGETVEDRLARLCDEEGVSFTINGSATEAMGPQPADTFMNLIRQCESTNMGVLLDGLNTGLDYVCRSSLTNRTVDLTVDANSGQVPATPGPQPVFDDQRIVNRVTVTNTNGSSAVSEDEDGPLGTAAVGVLDSRVAVNLASDASLPNIGAFLIQVSTPETMRYPRMLVDLVAAPELASDWLACFPTSRLNVENLSNRLLQLPAVDFALAIDGWTETLNSKIWRIQFNLSDYEPWDFASLNGLFRLEMSGQTLAANLVKGATSLSLATASGHALFTTTAKYPADFPLILNVAGWPIGVTAASGTSSPQTLTITAAPNTSTIPSGTAVTLWQPAPLAL